MENTKEKFRVQLLMAVTLAAFGLLLFMAAFIVPPKGVIDSSVLVAAGEVFTFSASLVGVDYSARMKYYNTKKESTD